jgi:hypothetical protein
MLRRRAAGGGGEASALVDGRAAQERMCSHPEPLALRVAGNKKGAQRVAGRAAQAARSVRCAHGAPRRRRVRSAGMSRVLEKHAQVTQQVVCITRRREKRVVARRQWTRSGAQSGARASTEQQQRSGVQKQRWGSGWS